MTLTVSLVKVGNSRAIIIPAKVLRKLNVKEDSKFEFSFGDDSTILIRKKDDHPGLEFPAVELTAVSNEEIRSFREGLVPVTPEEIDNDERLAYILTK